MSGKKRLKTIIENELRDLMGDENTRKAMDVSDRIKVLIAAIKWAAVDAKIGEAEEGSAFNDDEDNPDD